MFSGPEGYAQDPLGRIGLRFIWEYYVHRLFYCLRPCAGMLKPLALKGQLKSMPWHSRGCEKFDAIQHHDDFSHPLFRFYSPRSPGAASGPASSQPRGRQLAFAMLPRRSPSPILRFPGVQGWITSEVPGKDLTPRAPTLRRSGNTGAHTSLHAGGSKGRTRHTAAAEFGGLASVVAASFASFASAQARKLTRCAAAPLQIEPASLGFDLVLEGGRGFRPIRHSC